MPTMKIIGTESATNKAIGGVPTIHYFDFQSRGRGQVVRLMLIVRFYFYLAFNYCLSTKPSQSCLHQSIPSHRRILYNV